MLKKSIISMAMIGAVALALASSGGGDKKDTKATSGLKMVKSTPGFSLKLGRSYTSLPVKSNKVNSLAINQAVFTYRKGNTVYILPTQAEKCRPQASIKTNLNLLNVKVKLRK